MSDIDVSSLIDRLPLPLATLLYDAAHARSAMQLHQSAYYLWEVGLKLQAISAIACFAETGTGDPSLAVKIQGLSRPSLGKWWEFTRLFVSRMAAVGDPVFMDTQNLLLSSSARSDLPMLAGMIHALRSANAPGRAANTTVRVSSLIDSLVEYRNDGLGHGAFGRRRERFYEDVGRAMVSGAIEFFSRWDVLAGRCLGYVHKTQRAADGSWNVGWDRLEGLAPQRGSQISIPSEEMSSVPMSDTLYLVKFPAKGERFHFTNVHPLAVYLDVSREVVLLNARRGRDRAEYLSYSTGESFDRKELPHEQQQLFARLTGQCVSIHQVEQWAAKSYSDEGAETPVVSDVPRLGEYELLSRLGSGAMGIVYRAWQPSLNRQVALKKLMCVANPKSTARFTREIAALGRVRHPNVVQAFTAGVDGEHYFFTMELIEGATLSAVCDRLAAKTKTPADIDASTWSDSISTACEASRKDEVALLKSPETDPLPTVDTPPFTPLSSVAIAPKEYLPHIVELVRQIALGAHRLHQAGVIHRDIKPGNIMLTSDGQTAVLMDLGLAQILDESVDRLTSKGDFVGTIRYASPEQLINAELKPQTDIYSLGATLWELITLKPFLGVTEQIPMPQAMQRVQTREPDSPRLFNHQVDRDLEAVVLKCVAKDERQRYASAKDLALDLQNWLAGESVAARRASWINLTIKRNRRTIFATGLVLCFVLAQIAFYSWLKQPSANVDTAASTSATQSSAIVVSAETSLQSELDKAALPAAWSTYEVLTWAITNRGSARLHFASGDAIEVRDIDEIPTTEFQVEALKVPSVRGEIDSFVAKLRGQMSLRELNLSGTELGDAGASHLELLPALSSLTVDNCPIGEAGVKSIGKLTRLTFLSIGDPPESPDIQSEISQKKSNLHQTNRLNDAMLLDLRLLSNLETLIVASRNITGAGMSQLIENCPDLVSLSVELAPLRDDDIASISRLSHLRSLSLIQSELTDGSIESLGRIKRLTQLNVQGSQISFDGVRRLQTILPGCRVYGGEYSSRRNLVRAIVQVKGSVTVSTGSRSLKKIDDQTFSDLPGEFTTHQIDLQNVRPLPPELLELNDATELIVADSAISQHTIRQLPVLFPVLAILDLAGTSVTDREITALANMQSLQRVNLMRTNVSAKGISRLKSANPTCDVQWTSP